MKTIPVFLLAAAASLVTMRAEEPAFEEKRLDSVKASLLMPVGWHLREDTEEGVSVLQMTREKVAGGSDSFLVGLTLSVTPDVPGRTQLPPSKYAADLLSFAVEDSGGKVVTTDAPPFKTLRTEYVVDAESGRVSIVDVATANDGTGTLYFLAWQCPEAEAADLSELREKIIASLKFDPSF